MGDNWMWVASVVAAMEGHELTGRMRIQKTVKLLQRKGLPTDYRYSIYFYGPYSEELQLDLELLNTMGIVSETAKPLSPDGKKTYTYTADAAYDHDAIAPFKKWIAAMEERELVPLELAATYDAYRELGLDHDQADLSLRRKKGAKCTPENVAAAFALLRDLELPVGGAGLRVKANKGGRR